MNNAMLTLTDNEVAPIAEPKTVEEPKLLDLRVCAGGENSLGEIAAAQTPEPTALRALRGPAPLKRGGQISAGAPRAGLSGPSVARPH